MVSVFNDLNSPALRTAGRIDLQIVEDRNNNAEGKLAPDMGKRLEHLGVEEKRR
jgi:hypothetical protein